MTTRQAARIAVIADTTLQRHVLQHVLLGCGYQVVLNSDPERLQAADLQACETDLWLVDLAQSDDLPLLDSLLEQQAPVLFGEGRAPERNSEHFPRWERRLFGKLKRLVGDPADAVGPSLQALLGEAKRPARIELPAALAHQPLATGEPARQVWLLAASLGGPEAVKAFLDALPGGLPVGLLYAQHIDASFEASLPQAVGRHSQWPVRLVEHGETLCNGEVRVVPIAHELGFDAKGRLNLAERPWPEPYSPSIDQMMLNLAQQFGPRCGVIAFSGMGSDGSAAAAYVRRQGGVIWTQSADSCACSSMPDSLRDGDYSSFSDHPHALAQALVRHLAAQCGAEPISSYAPEESPP
ncbi:chemotaxis protein CheB [Pseudomonas sp. B392_1p]|uniref:chemotaxis protein CheB n=1 Tax=Pseudomonas sp. B392_1p TaxID=3457507 RepID=UPI003FD676D8